MKALCDNCKKEYEAEEDDVFQDINTNTQAKDVRLCPDCMKDLEDIF
jgi:hypothetical protein